MFGERKIAHPLDVHGLITGLEALTKNQKEV